MGAGGRQYDNARSDWNIATERSGVGFYKGSLFPIGIREGYFSSTRELRLGLHIKMTEFENRALFVNVEYLCSSVPRHHNFFFLKLKEQRNDRMLLPSCDGTCFW